ncbi:hypothetical protein, partial [Helicobacter sp. MIT 14-3879]|uniref:hypothetical protein n=1 Tax=Helicobacter sp. MIT 14-3879 TaxID=2040649 RepID=UPI000E1F7D21
ITSGQLAWFVCSGILSFIISSLFFIIGNILQNTLYEFFSNLWDSDFFKLTIFLTLPINLLYKHNIFPLIMGVLVASTPIFLSLHFGVINIVSLIIYFLFFLIKKLKILGFFIIYYFAVIITWNFWRLMYSIAR